MTQSIKRREFLLQSLACAAGVGLASNFVAQSVFAAAEKSGVKLGLTTYTIGGKWTIEDIIENLTKAEIFGVELRTDMKYSHGMELSTDKAKRTEAKKRFADSPVQLVGVASGERYDSPDAAVVDKAVERTKELLQLSADLGSSGLRVFPNDFQKNVPQEKTIEQIAAALKRLTQTAEDLNQEVRLEAHGSVGRLPVLRQIVEAVSHPKVRVKLNSDFRDTEGDGLEANLNTVKDYLAGTAHVHDLLAEKYEKAKFYETQFAFLNKNGWNGWCLLEINDKPEDRLAEIVRQRNCFREQNGR